MTVTWEITNTGGAPVTQAFSDQLRVRNLDISGGRTLHLATLDYDPALDGAIGVGETRTREVTLTWPTGQDGAGRISFEVTTDVDVAITEDNDTGTGETNNLSTLPVINAPDLVVENLRIDVDDPQAGDTITLSWTMRNTGTSDALSTWSDRVWLYNDRRDTPDQALRRRAGHAQRSVREMGWRPFTSRFRRGV